MLPLRHKNRWRLAGILILSVVWAAAVMPTLWLWPYLPQAKFLMLDKWLHLLTFLVLALWFSGQYERSSYWRLAVGLTAFGALIEVCQRMISYRMGEWIDLIADMIGAGIGLVIAVAGLGGWSLRFEQWLTRDKVGVD
ncbi:MAG: VanZ family protein [Woeseia sp.]